MTIPGVEGHKGDILVVDDKPDNLRLLSTILKEHGYKVRRVIRGQLAIDAAQVNPPDLILLDILMPDIDGFTVCQALKKNDNTQDIPIIFLSALNDTFDKVKAFDVGGADYITKPFHVQEVIARVENQLTIQRHKAQLQQEIRDRKNIEAALQAANQELQRLANLDGLTGVANRRRFDQFLAEQWTILSQTQGFLSLMLIDLDYFKAYNDTYGHLAGDDCLKAVAQTLHNTITTPLALAARYGGEEFSLILPSYDLEQTMNLAEQVRQNIHKLQIPHLSSPVSTTITVSLGAAICIPDAEMIPETLIAAADQALYHAKSAGRDRYYIEIPA